MMQLISILFMVGQLIFIVAKVLNFAVRVTQGR
jgi:hypothetical protein